jgi:hypothetical protein
MALSSFNLAGKQEFILLFPALPPAIFRDLSVGSTGGITTTMGVNEPLRLNILNTVMPTMSFDRGLTDHIMKHQEIIGRITYETWNTTFIVDELYENYRLMFKWMQYIDANIASIDRHNKRDYSVDASLEVMTNFRQKVIRFEFKGLSPSSLGELTFDYTDPGIITCDVSFDFDYIELEE